jgi:FkbM family methyltransferase
MPRHDVSRRTAILVIGAVVLALGAVLAVVYRIESRRSPIATVPGLGRFVIRDPSDMIEATLLRGQPWEPWVVAAFRRHVTPGMHVADIGAFNGVHSVALANLVGERGRVYAFEPNPTAFDLLRKNVRLNHLEARVVAYPFAVSDTPSRVAIATVDVHNLGGTHVCTGEDRRAQARGCGGPARDEIQAIRIDDDIARWFPARVGFVKIDVEGYEDRVIAGARAWLKRDRPIIHIEILDDAARRAQAIPVTRAQVIHMIEALGYRLRGVQGLRQNEHEDLHNYIFEPAP